MSAYSILQTGYRQLSGGGKARTTAFIVAFAAIGGLIIYGVHAATGGSNAAIISGSDFSNASNGATIQPNGGASGGPAVLFAGSQSGGQTASCASSPSTPSGSNYGSGALSTWCNALANDGSQPATWVAIGDSLTEGEGSSTVTGRWINQVLNQLRSKYPVSGVTGGFGYIPSWYNTYDLTNGSDYWGYDQAPSSGEIKAKDDGNDGQQLGNGAALGLRATTLKQGVTESFAVKGTSIDILYNYSSNGTFTYSIKNGASGTIAASSSNNSSAPCNSGSAMASCTAHIALGSSANYTVTISGGTNSVVLEGVMTYDGDENKGIHLYDAAQSAITSGDYAKQATNVAAISAAVKADLVTIMLGGNDLGRGGGNSQYTATNLKSIVSAIRSAGQAAGHTPSIVIMVPYTNSDPSWSSYATAIKGVAGSDTGLGLLDLSSFPGEVGVSSQYLASDSLHPSDKGQTQLANMIAPYLEIAK